jgi:hypothetical protein
MKKLPQPANKAGASKTQAQRRRIEKAIADAHEKRNALNDERRRLERVRRELFNARQLRRAKTMEHLMAVKMGDQGSLDEYAWEETRQPQ